MRTLGLVLALTFIGLSAPTFAEDLEFQLINSSSVNLAEMYVAPSESDEWGDDILGVEILAAGETGTVTIADGMDVCAYDMRFVTDNGTEVTASADLCELGTFTLND
jgi:hypothetical protein